MWEGDNVGEKGNKAQGKGEEKGDRIRGGKGRDKCNKEVQGKGHRVIIKSMTDINEEC